MRAFLLSFLALFFWGFTGGSIQPQKNVGFQKKKPLTATEKPTDKGKTKPTDKGKAMEQSPLKALEGKIPQSSKTTGARLLQISSGRGMCLVNGMAMYDGAAWAPDPCTICICDRGTQQCDSIECEVVSCPRKRIPPQECCPVCSVPELTNQKKFDHPTKEGGKDLRKLKQKKDMVEKDKKRNEETSRRELVELQNKSQKDIRPKKESKENSKSGVATIPQEVDSKKKGIKAPGKNATIKQTEVNAFKQRTENKKKTSHKQETNVSKQHLNSKKQDMAATKKADTHKQRQGEKLKKENEKTLQSGEDRRPPEITRPSKTTNRKPSIHDSTSDEDEEGEKDDDDDVEVLFAPQLPEELVPPPGMGNHIASLPMNCLLSETAIACGNAKLTQIPTLYDSGLKTLYLAENDISSISAEAFSGLPNLEWLDLSKNKLNDSSLPSYVFQNLTNLKRLNLDGNRFTAVPLLPPLLLELKMNDNSLQVLQPYTFKGLSKLLTLELEGNNLHDGNVHPVTFQPLQSLIYLRLDRNKFRAIPSGLPPSLQELHLDSNHIEEVPEGVLNKTLNLSVLTLSNNRIQENHIGPRAWIHLPKLESLDLAYNQIVHVPSFLPRVLKQLTLHHNQIERIPGYVFAHMKPGLEFLHLSHNKLRSDGIHGVSFLGLYKSLAELLLDNNHLQAIPRGILNLKSLQVLRLNDNHIRYVPLNSICDTRKTEDSTLVSVHLENNFIDRRLIPPTAFSCIKTYHSIILRPQRNEE
ncbi:extracellular matrix protein 2-like [Protopterus annectens]|uniref:extracellular matrix protein 2-like n=1 Tax=Protopterus annectens TaxID=7888 RepID=UPI001CFBAC31|nr:extracellular matrix protein 2-like [Protopterus annectens]